MIDMAQPDPSTDDSDLETMRFENCEFVPIDTFCAITGVQEYTGYAFLKAGYKIRQIEFRG